MIGGVRVFVFPAHPMDLRSIGTVAKGRGPCVTLESWVPIGRVVVVPGPVCRSRWSVYVVADREPGARPQAGTNTTTSSAVVTRRGPGGTSGYREDSP